MVWVEKKLNLNKMKRNQKWKNPHTLLHRQILCFSLYKNRQSKVKLRLAGALLNQRITVI